jgi:hypothetical protein
MFLRKVDDSCAFALDRQKMQRRPFRMRLAWKGTPKGWQSIPFARSRWMPSKRQSPGIPGRHAETRISKLPEILPVWVVLGVGVVIIVMLGTLG